MDRDLFVLFYTIFCFYFDIVGGAQSIVYAKDRPSDDNTVGEGGEQQGLGSLVKKEKEKEKQ